MIDEILARHAWLWPLAWQSTLCLGLGLGGSFVLRTHPTRAHRVLLLALVASVVVPFLSHTVKHKQWGLLTAKPAILEVHTQTVGTLPLEPPEREVEIAPSLAPSTRTAVPPMVQKPHRSFHPSRLLLPLWLAGTTMLLARLGWRWLLGYRLVRQSASIDSDEIADALKAAKVKLNVASNIELRCHTNVRSAVIWCWSRCPVLLVPKHNEYRDGIDWPAVMCHELAHWKRRDHATSLWAELLACILPWQLLAWVARFRLTTLCEEACDDWVIASGLVDTRYARTLLGLTPQGAAALAPAVVMSKTGLAARVRRIVEHKCANPFDGRHWTLAAAGLAALLAAGIAFAQTRPTPVATETRTVESVLSPPASVPRNGAVKANTLVLHLVDPDGQPVAGAQVGPYAHTVEEPILGMKVSFAQPQVSDPQGKVIFDQTYFAIDEPYTLYVLHEERGLAAFVTINSSDRGEELLVSLHPACHVHGNLSSEALTALGFPLYWTNVYLHLENSRPLSHSCENQQFEFWVPPGEYELQAYGSGRTDSGDASGFLANTHDKLMAIEVTPGQSDLDVGVVDLSPDYLATLMGKPAPELTQIKGWKNGGPVTLAELRGKLVLLDFWGYWCGPCVRVMPKLMELHDAFGDKGLVIIGVHDDSAASIAEMDSHLESARRDYWNGRDLPFLVALDGGGDRPIRGTEAIARGATTAAYGITSFPTTVLIGTQGEVIGHINLNDAEGILSELLDLDVADQQARAWEQRFYEVYRLEDDEIIKRIAPPFIPERMDYYVAEHSSQAKAIPRGPDYMWFHWDGTLQNWGMGFGSATTLDNVLGMVVQLKRFEYDGPQGLLDVDLPGDWITRNEMPQEVKLSALEALIARELGRTIRFEKRTVDRQVIVATGRFKFHRPTETYEGASVHMYADEADPDEGAGGGTATSLSDFLQTLGDRVNMPVVDKTDRIEDMRIPYRHHHSSRVYREPDALERARKLRLLLDHLTEQTELQFEVATRPVEVWFVVEDTVD